MSKSVMSCQYSPRWMDGVDGVDGWMNGEAEGEQMKSAVEI